MIDYETLNALNAEAERRARRGGVVPVAIAAGVLEQAETLSALHARGYSIPFIGSRVPRGFRPLGTPLFVDISGWGSPDEPALTMDATLAKMRELTREHGTLAWATTEMGPFQAYLQAYKVKG